MALPSFLKKYFWDTDFKKIDKKVHKKAIIERILKEGDEKALFWLFQNFSKKEIKNAILNSRSLSKKDLNFWMFFFGIKKKCLKKFFQKKQKIVWPY